MVVEGVGVDIDSVRTDQLLTIGAGLSQLKELKDLLANLILMVARVLKDCRVQAAQLNDVFSALIECVPPSMQWSRDS